MRVIFVDFDGVLNSAKFFKELADSGLHSSEIIHHLDPIKVERLNRVIDATGAFVVVSSTWRNCKGTETPEKLQACLRSFGYKHSVLGVTPTDKTCQWHDGKCDEGHRGGEINQWLVDNPHFKVNQFAIVDDSSDMYPHNDRLVKTTWEDGIQDEHVDKLIEMLRTLHKVKRK